MRGAVAPRWWPAWAYGLLVVVLTVVLWQSAAHLAPAEAGLSPRVQLERADPVLGSWLYWDGGAYHSIAERGYPSDDVAVFRAGGEAKVAFFPGYPLVARAVDAVVGDLALSLILVTLASGLALAVVFHRWALLQLSSPAAAGLGVAALFLFPWAYVLAGAAYGEALFVLAAVSAFLLLERDQPLLAGLAGAMASGTRVAGVAVVVGLLVAALQRRGVLRFDRWRPRFRPRGARRVDLGLVLAPGGLVAFMAFCWARYGDSFAFSTAQRGWGSSRGLRTWLKEPFWDLVLHSPDFWFVMRLVLHALVGLAFCLAIPAVWRRFGAGYGLYCLVVIGLPMLGASAFASMGRHMLAAFPVFGLLGERLAAESRPRAVAYLATSAVLLVVWTSLWARGYWMA